MKKTDVQPWLNEIEGITRQYDAEFSMLSAEELNWKPSPDKWSIAQCIDHVITVNESYYPVFEQLINNTFKPSLMQRMPLLPGLFGKMLYSSLSPDRKRKVKTFPIWEPAMSNINRDIVDRFKQHQERLKEEIEHLEFIDFEKQVISSPASKYIVYTLEDAMKIIIVHERRHLEQAKEVNNSRLNNK